MREYKTIFVLKQYILFVQCKEQFQKILLTKNNYNNFH